MPGDPNHPPLTRSNFDPGHRITLSGGYDIPVPAGLNVVASVFYSGQSGRPWSVLYGNDYNGDVRGTNDLLYIPRSADEVTVLNGTAPGSFADLQTYLNGEKCISDFTGQIQERNACRAPWTNTLDFRVNVGLPFKRVKAEITWDILNLINLFDSQAGLFEYRELQRPAGGAPAGEPGWHRRKPIYNIQNIYLNGVLQTPEQQFTRDDLRSRWQMQFGGRIRF